MAANKQLLQSCICYPVNRKSTNLQATVPITEKKWSSVWNYLQMDTTQSSSYFIWDMSGLTDMQQSCYTVPEKRTFTDFKRLWTSPSLAPQLKHGDVPWYLLIRELF